LQLALRPGATEPCYRRKSKMFGLTAPAPAIDCRLKQKGIRLPAGRPTHSRWRRPGMLDVYSWLSRTRATALGCGHEGRQCVGPLRYARNVAEWCHDFYAATITRISISRPVWPVFRLRRVWRGGGWGANSRHLPFGVSQLLRAGLPCHLRGFRVVRVR